MKKEEKIIMYDSPEAAKEITVTGWVAADNTFWGKDEHMARYCGCTHQKCECGEIMSKGWTKCDECRRKISREKYLSYPIVEWDKESPIFVYGDDKYFFSYQDLMEYCSDNELEPEELQLLLCKPNYLWPIDADYWSDVFPEDVELPQDLQTHMDALNEYIKTAPPASWSGDNKRIIVTNEEYKKWLE
jgi:hypothetical protein